MSNRNAEDNPSTGHGDCGIMKLPANEQGLWPQDPRTYQSTHWAMTQSYLTQFRTAIDCGAHVGIFTLRMAELFQRVIAIEPTTPELVIANTQHLTNVEVLPIGVSDGETTLYRYNPGKTTACTELHQEPNDCPVKVMPIDLLGISDVDLIKIDTQGLEKQVIQGADSTIRQYAPTIHIETRDQALIEWICHEYDYQIRGRHIKDWCLQQKNDK
ncbi:FkbM family methyltransferase [Phage DSL-LC06]|nr:FkbM family methyltransferase [Phage DSL-LC06]